MRWTMIIIFFLSFHISPGQSGAAKRALKALDEGDFEKAEKQILRGIEKDSLDPLLYYDIAIYQLNQTPVNIDSASSLERESRRLWFILPYDDMQKYNKAGLSESEINKLRISIDSLGFIRAKTANSEIAYLRFLKDFPEARQTDKAISLRDSVAFSTASTENTYDAYHEFMDKYPGAMQYGEAQVRYDRLLFEASTNPGTLKALEKFLRDYPNTPYRRQVEESIFLIRTVVPEREAYESVIRDYPHSAVSMQARNYLFSREKEHAKPDSRLWGDSLIRMYNVNADVWIATFDKSDAVFLDGEGRDKFTIERSELSERYECQPLAEDLVVGTQGLFTRTGDQLYQGSLDEVEFWPYGLVKISYRGRVGAVTSWGRAVLPVDYSDIRLVGDQVLIARRGGGFAIFSLAGLQLTDFEFDDVVANSGFLQVAKNGKVALIAINDLQQAVAIKDEFKPLYLDDYEMLPSGEIWMSLGNKETITDTSFHELIALDEQEIEILSNGYILRKDNGVTLYSRDKLQKFSTEETLLDYNDRYIRFSSKEGEGLFDLVSFRFVALPDSAELAGRYAAITYQKNGVKAYVNSPEPQDVPGTFKGYKLLRHHDIEFVVFPGARSNFIVVDNELISIPASREMGLLNDSLIVLDQNAKKGLWNLKDQSFVLPARYEGLANFDGTDLSLFRNKKFGLYRVTDNIVIPESYEKLIIPFGDSLFSVVSKGQHGVINGDNEVIIPAQFDDILPWTDSLALVKEKEAWYFYSIPGKVRSDDALTTLRFMGSDDAWLIAMIDRKFGVFSKNGGEIIPATFDDVLNIGTAEIPMFFTETYVEAADLHVVIYFDQFGNLLKRQAMDPDLFYEIYCED